jgi:hypothetical protein
MKKLEIALTILVMGSLWGIAELLPLPTFLYVTAGVLFLTIGRVLVNRIGSSIAIGCVVCAFKLFVSTCFFACMWGGILAVAFSFDLFASLLWKEENWSVLKSAFLGSATAAIAAPLFLLWVYWLVPEPNWVEAGLPKAIRYLTHTGLYSTLAGLVAAPLGFMLGSFLYRWNPIGRKALQ